MSIFTALWIVWIAFFVIVEGAALYVGHGTLSAHIWALQKYPVCRAFIMALCIWLVCWHLGLEELLPQSVRQTHKDDGLLAAFVFAFTLFVSRIRGKS